MLRRHSRSPRFASVWLLLLAVAARGLIPAGFMPDFKNSGAPLVLCTQQGTLTLPGTDTGPHNHAHLECPFAFALGMAAAPGFDLAMEFPVTVSDRTVALQFAEPALGSAASFSARAPPHLV